MKTIEESIKQQKEYFLTGKTKDYSFRKKQLLKLKTVIEENEEKILDALRKDLGKCSLEAYTSEIGFVLRDIEFTLKHLKKNMKSKKVKTDFINFPAKSIITPEPYGSVLIIGPWNYPFQLLFSPAVGAIAAGNTVVLKPSEISENTSDVIFKIISENFSTEHISVIEGGVSETQDLLNQRFDYIFFTGSTNVGKIIMKEASKNLIPVTLELGGKSPCIVDKTTDLEKTAERIVWGKFINAGQTCVAPDFILADRGIKDNLLSKIAEKIIEFYGDNIKSNSDYARIISKNHFSRLKKMIKGDVYFGGKSDESELYIEPVIIDNADWSHKAMEEEIFGPILPVLTYDDIESAVHKLQKMEKPLALYIFSKDKSFTDFILENVSSGGVCVNDTISHIVSHYLPFGGVGYSGMGSCHGEQSFKTFSHYRSIMKRSFWGDPKTKYPPYNMSLERIKKIMKWLF